MSSRVADPYLVLGVSRGATLQDIKAAYRRIAKETHPDRNPESANVTRFRDATEAYAVLSDSVQRTAYDSTGFVDDSEVDSARDEIFAMVAHVRAMAAEARYSARSSATRGLLWFGGGSVLSLGAFAAAQSSQSGGRYPVFWGAIIFGGWQALQGFHASWSIRKAADDLERDLWDSIGT